ncbi:excinuclease ABC subunit UvrC [Treponema putidum]|uniref:UvrABC system protein C n=2 Tax=Treponema putidum TaxID=221027 RepID=A0AAE9SH93_9SPIR|nr:excinuclease ABC subunit UvrC [Treponema putidum]AIN93959.1 excinuclease ABC subunit C [Treponema putidum]UTY29993.1 excinuclease ABC subunit C [Treponema putidum]UTY32451.1 excinuclease ABC subunit C [Treponema putidum]UTY32805.1 excinuclease ABC subunit C [Treponema putidum]
MEKNNVREKLHAVALSAPKTSGVYLWKDKAGTVIYVGKAKSLKNRLSSYFTSNRDIKTRILVSRADSIEYIQTENEYEALLLENTLIKKHKPRYNINLKDGKTYPVLKLTNEEFPKLYRTRNIKNDGSKYFGPFPNVSAVDMFLALIKHNYTLRQCKRLKKRETPCLYFHIGRCKAPCCGKISAEEYGKDIEEITMLLEGEMGEVSAALKEKMKEAAEKKEFEKAARLRDGIQAVYALRGQNIVQDMDPESRDYIAWAFEGTMVSIAVLKMRNGRLVGRDLYRSHSLKEEGEILSEFISAYYTSANEVPPKIFIPQAADGNALIEKWLNEELHAKTRISIIPLEKENITAEETASSKIETAFGTATSEEIEEAASKKIDYTVKEPAPLAVQEKRLNLSPAEIKHHKAALKMARFNAKEDALRRLREQGDFAAVEDLQKRLNLPCLPQRIEGFDIAHLGGTFTVAALISFKEGNPDKKNYRIFRLKNTDGIIDDYASMREVIARRYTRLVNEGADLPDLILIDGGIGQVNAASKIVNALDLGIPVIGLAEKNEEVYFPHNSEPVILPRRSDALRLLQRIRDEAHRFSNTRNNKLRRANKLKTEFEGLPHIGKKRAFSLLKAFGNMEGLKNTTAQALSETAKISLKQAEEVLASVKGNSQN